MLKFLKREKEMFKFKIPPFDGMQNLKRMKFLYESIQTYARYNTGLALEVGCYKCCSTVFLANSCLEKGINKIIAIDTFTGTESWNQKFDTYQDAEARLKEYNLDGIVELLRANSHDIIWEKDIDVLHIDADHEYEAVKADLLKFSQYLVKDGLLIMDDYDSHHQGVKHAIHEFLVQNNTFEVVAVNNDSSTFGSICLQKK